MRVDVVRRRSGLGTALSALRPVAVVVLAVAALVSIARSASSRQPEAEPKTAVARAASAPAIRDDTVPAGAVRSYIEAARRRNSEQAARYLNLSDVLEGSEPETGATLARQLKVVLDQKLWIEFDKLSRELEGDTSDGLPPGTDRVGTIERTSRGNVDVLVERVADDGRTVWKIASSTVELVPDLYDQFGYGPLAEILPEPFFVLRLFEIALWQWIALLALIVAAFAVSWIAGWIVFRALGPIVARTATDIDDRVLRVGLSPLRFAFLLALVFVGTWFLWLPVPALQLMLQIEKGLAVVAVAWFAVRMVDVFADLVQRGLERRGEDAAATIVPLGRRTVKVFLFLVAGIALLQNLGFNVTGLIAGLGVGGLAVALAAQKTIENFFGGVSVISDRPVRVGDFCKFAADQVGTVEEIGLRSTRIRTLDRTLVTIPNADFSQRPLENYAARDRMRLYAVLNLRYETTPDQLRWVLAAMRKLLLGHPKILRDPARVRFVAFGAHSLDLELFAYVDSRDWSEFLGVREDIFLRLMDIVAASGTGFAFPSQTLYLGRDTGVDDERQAETERVVAGWRESNELPFPDFPPGTEERIENKIDYPPSGSSGAA